MIKKIMLIEDDLEMQKLINDFLYEFDYKCVSFDNPKEALMELENNKENYGLVILDLMLPLMDGFDVCKKIKQNFNLPVIISSARGDIGNKIYGYELGVDDYLAKPYEPRELVLRIKAVLRRYESSVLNSFSDFKIDLKNNTVFLDNYQIEFTKLEFNIFYFFLTHSNQNISREQITKIINLPDDTKARTIDMHISNIRQKIGDDAKNPKYIKSIWGIGYKFIG